MSANYRFADGDRTTDWPTWLLEVSTDITASLDSISKSHARLNDQVRNGYKYRYVWNQQVNGLVDRLVNAGILSPTSPYPKTEFNLTKSEMAVNICKNGRALQIFESQSYVHCLAVMKLLDGAVSGLVVGDILIPFICFRGIVEHVAIYHSTIGKLQGFSVPKTFEQANLTLGEIYEVLTNSAYATRVDWKRLLGENSIDFEAAGTLSYTQNPNRADIKAKSVLNAIDTLGKRVKGIRNTYELLCEFAHPNVGNMFMFTQSQRQHPDSRGVIWVDKVLGPEPPRELLVEGKSLLVAVFQQIGRCLIHLEKLLDTAKKEQRKVQSVSQLVIRTLVSQNSGILDPDLLCPCGSKKTLRRCCQD